MAALGNGITSCVMIVKFEVRKCQHDEDDNVVETERVELDDD